MTTWEWFGCGRLYLGNIINERERPVLNGRWLEK